MTDDRRNRRFEYASSITAGSRISDTRDYRPICPIGLVPHRLRASRSPASTSCMCLESRMPRRVSRVVLSRVMTWLTFTTQSRSRPAVPAASATLPGAADSRRFDVIVATVTVLIRERLNASAETTSTGRRQAGAEPRGRPRSAHHTSLRATTSQLSLAVEPRPDLGRPSISPPRKPPVGRS